MSSRALNVAQRSTAREEAYNRLAPAYEMLASPARIRAEVDALEASLHAVGAVRLLDAGCAAGFHSCELARGGFRVTGIDISAAMLREARAHASTADLPVRFVRADLQESDRVRGAPFDAVLCLGNTLASFPSRKDRLRVFRAFGRALRPGGLLILQLRDLSAVARTGYTFPTRSRRRGKEEWILLRRQDPVARGVRFVSILLYRACPDVLWETHISESILEVVGLSSWRGLIAEAGFQRVRFASDLRGTPRPKQGGADLVVFARRDGSDR